MHSPGFGRSRLSPSTWGAGPFPDSCPRFMELTVALPHPVAESDHLSPKALQFPLMFYRPRISKGKCTCQVCHPASPDPFEDHSRGLSYASITSVVSPAALDTGSRVPHPTSHCTRPKATQPGCMLGHRCHWLGTSQGPPPPGPKAGHCSSSHPRGVKAVLSGLCC